MVSPKEDEAGKWHALDVQIEAEAREAVEYALMEAGALGTETENGEANSLKVTGYFDSVPDREQVRAEVAEALRIYEFPTSAVRDMQLRNVADQDWLGEWKKNWRPTIVGRFVIAPPWSEIPLTNDCIVIRIEPGMAFGTGTHETTRLCLAAIEKHFRGNSFLDVGTGTGILAIAAAKILPGTLVVGCDTDHEALEIARENAGLNGVSSIEFQSGSIDETFSSADFVCANLTADVIQRIMGQLVGITCGRLVLSGILDTQLDDVLTQLAAYGITSPLEVTHDGEWVAIIV